MPSSGYILAIDQGTTGTTALLVDGSGHVIWQTYQEVTQIYPNRAGWNMTLTRFLTLSSTLWTSCLKPLRFTLGR